MARLKFTADKIFDGSRFLDEDNALITTEWGDIEAIVPMQDAGDGIQHHPGILSPGFVNCHCHLELSHMKGVIPEKTGLVDFVITVMQQRNFTEDVIYDAIEKAEAEMQQNGIVAVGDICNTAHTLPQKQKSNLHYYNFIEATGFVPAFATKRFEQAQGVYAQFTNRESLIVNGEQSPASFTIHDSRFPIDDSRFTSIVPHAPYSTSAALMQLINQHSAGKVITIHNQETSGVSWL
jgi:cytosine/adenosine deaminase-related metal-dependent hydrolase